ncbi:ribonuclease J [Candidatus Liberibacter sp.]|uniref:ribonuclease J n=1 Tax=Candidatus Liberibacter sp. TaxID=34022 RepID=UPI0015F590D6|nr:ribonuclease J [Candidatus Liberibacter sp.]MBA5724323.1 ribonuclease J [Candidatus Liberibacter sp.]
MIKQEDLVFLPLGGVGEIGMNMALYGYGIPENRQWIMVDCGVAFPKDDLPGVDLVFPDISFLLEERKNLVAIIITHAHEDHYGAILDLCPFLGDVPVYASPFALGLLEAKSVYERVPADVLCKPFKAGDKIDIKPFLIEAVQVNHSIPESMAFIIRTPVGNIVHTGDWKLGDTVIPGGMTDKDSLCSIGKEGVLALMCDSTNATDEEAYTSEEEVSENLYDFIKTAEGCVAITTFSSNVGRICSIITIAKKLGREVLLLGSSLKRVASVSSSIGLINPDQSFIPEESFGLYDRKKVVVILTGSQGEPRSALAKLARNEMRNITLQEKDIVIFSSRTILGNEIAVNDVKNKLIERGVRVITEDLERPVHVSGHPYRKDLKSMYEWVKPKIAVAIHGEPIHLVAQNDLALQIGVPIVPSVRNGQILRLFPDPVGVIGEVIHGRIFKDGYLIGDFEDLGIAKRKKLSRVGHLAASVVLDGHCDIIGKPEVVNIGLPSYCSEGNRLSEILLKTIMTTVGNIPRSQRKDFRLLRDAISRALRSTVEQVWGKKPIVTIFINKGSRN